MVALVDMAGAGGGESAPVAGPRRSLAGFDDEDGELNEEPELEIAGNDLTRVRVKKEKTEEMHREIKRRFKALGKSGSFVDLTMPSLEEDLADLMEEDPWPEADIHDIR